jgi:glutathione peroxidase
VKWNFTKFLVDRAGRVLARYAPTTRPEEIDADVAELLTGPEPRARAGASPPAADERAAPPA